MTGTYERKEFVGGAPATTIVGALTDVATSLTLASATSWPTADTYPFVATIDQGLATEEKVLIAARTGTACSSITRGYDDTTAQAHSDGAEIQHTLDASTVDQVNRLANLMSAKGAVIGHNGTNPTAITPTAQADDGEDGYALVVNNAAGVGLAFERPIHVVDAASAPTVDGVPRVWFDQATGLIRTSDGTDWKIPAQCPVFGSTGARDTFFGGTPVQAGNMCIVGTGSTATLQVWDGTIWVYQGIPRFADSAARDAYYTSPVIGDMAYLNDSNFLTQYRVSEWVTINHKVVTSATQPTGATVLEGDIWLQPLV